MLLCSYPLILHLALIDPVSLLNILLICHYLMVPGAVHCTRSHTHLLVRSFPASKIFTNILLLLQNSLNILGPDITQVLHCFCLHQVLPHIIDLLSTGELISHQHTSTCIKPVCNTGCSLTFQVPFFILICFKCLFIFSGVYSHCWYLLFNPSSILQHYLSLYLPFHILRCDYLHLLGGHPLLLCLPP